MHTNYECQSRNGIITIYTKKVIETKLKTTQNYLHEWHGINYSITELKTLIKPCRNYPNDAPFHKYLKVDPLTIIIDSYIHFGVLDIINRYFHNDNKKLLILDDSKEYPRYFPKKDSNSSVTIYEPSDAPLTDTFMRITNKKKDKLNRAIRYDMKSINYTSNWKLSNIDNVDNNNDNNDKKNEEKSKLSRSNKMDKSDNTNNINNMDNVDNNYDYVFINLSLKYLITNPHIMMKNLNTITNIGSDILVVFIDGETIDTLLGARDKFEFKDNAGKIIIGVYKYDDTYDSDGNVLKQFVLYIRETIRYSAGSVEIIIHKEHIEDLFKNKGYFIVASNMLSDEQKENITNDKHIMNESDKSILFNVLSWFRYILFKRT